MKCLVGLLYLYSLACGQPGGDGDVVCVCNPEDSDTGAVCANNGQTYTSACDFRLRQGLRAEIGIRCVGPCPCDDSLLAVGIDCSAAASAAAQTLSTSSGLEFCGTNAVTYNNENMFMCDQVQDQTLAISCPGSCPCQLADCPHILTATPRPVVPPPTRGYTLPPSPMTSVNTSAPYATAQLNTVPGLASMNPPPVPQPPFGTFVPTLGLQINQGYQPENNGGFGDMQQRPAPQQPVRGGYGSNRDDGGIPVSFQQPQSSPAREQSPNFPSRELHKQTSLGPSNYNPLTEALRSVPFRLFRHLYILITVASEGMKQIPMQIARNMQSRLPPYIKEIPIEMAKSIQEALSIHFNSLAQQVKDTVEQVRLLIDENANRK